MSKSVPAPWRSRTLPPVYSKCLESFLRRICTCVLALAAIALTPPALAALAFVQVGSTNPQSAQTSVSLPYSAAQTAGDLNVIVVGWSNSSSHITQVTDSKGNTYVLAVGPTVQTGTATQAVYYAASIAAATAGANTVTVTFDSAAPYVDLRAAEYSGAASSSPVDVVATATGTSGSNNSGTVTTANANDLLVGASYVGTSTTAAGSGYTKRVITSPDGDILEDRIVTTAGSYSATATIAPSGWWIMQMVAFKAAGSGGGDTQPPTAPSNLAATAASSSQINLTWTASTDNVGVTAYLVERCSGSGCSSFSQIASVTGTSYSNTGLSASTSYSYRVRATDAAGNLSSYSGVATAMTQAPADTQPPTAPTNLAATAASVTQINLTWTASTDNVGVTAYLVESCSGSGCSSFTQIASVTGTSYSNTALAAGTSYTYRVRATDAAGNLSGYSATATASTPVDTQAPTAPSNLAATAVSSTQINLAWSASTDNVGVTAYLVERCTGSGCTTFAQIASVTGTSYSNTGLTASTTYSYRVRASDAAGNLSSYSGIASASTQAASAVIAYVQGNSTAPQTAQTTVTVAFTSAQAAGDLNVVAIGWTDSTSHVLSVTDTHGNLYELAAGPTSGTAGTLAMYVAPGIVAATAGSNQVTVTFDAAVPYPDLRIAEYSGLASANPVDVGAEATGNNSTSSSGTVTTTNANDLLVGANYVSTTTTGAGSGFTSRMITQPDADILEDHTVTSVGSYSATAPVSPAGAWVMDMVALEAAGSTGGGGGGSGDTQPPTAPSNLVATTASSSQINLSWTASTDNVGVTGYLIERCAGSGCTTFTQIANVNATSYGSTALAPSTQYTYRIRATDAAGNLSGYSNTASATTNAAQPVAPSFVQANYATPQTAQSSVAVSFNSPQTAGNLNVVAIGWGDSTATVKTVTDSSGNVYVAAATPVIYTGVATHSIYYAKNIVGSASNTVTVTFSTGAKFVDMRVAEYAGLDQNNPLDVAGGRSGQGYQSSSGGIFTTSASDMLVAGNFVSTSVTGPGLGFTQRLLTTPDEDILEDRLTTSAGSYAAEAQLFQEATWVMQVVAFRAANQPAPDTTPPTVAISVPTGGAGLTGTSSFTAIASDTGTGVAGVQFQVDGVNVGPVVTTSPYTTSFNTAQFPNGSHVISAYAWDANRNMATSAPVSVNFSNSNAGNPAQGGLWSGVFNWPLVAVHLNLLRDGRVIAWDRMSTGTADPYVWDPVTSQFTVVPVNDGANLFCDGHTTLADGRIMTAGGHVADDVGLPIGRIFDPGTNTWSSTPNMSYARWYPTLTTLPNGNVLTMSGEVNCAGCDTPIPELYTPSTNTWTEMTAASNQLPYYPQSYVLPDGRLFVAATTETAIASQVLDLNALTWTTVDSRVFDAYSSTMYLPGKILKTGTATDSNSQVPAAATAYVIDMTAASPQWRQVASMAYARSHQISTTLPDGNVLVTGGGTTTGAYDTADAVYPAELWSPTTETWTTMASMNTWRLYHHTAVLLPDGRVLVTGSGRSPGPDPRDQLNAEIYSPPYLFKGARPVISSAPAGLTYNQPFTIQTPNAAQITSVVLIGNGDVTHGFNMNQHFVPLTFTTGSGALTVTAPANANLATPGYYMLFIVNSSGIPSVAAMVHF